MSDSINTVILAAGKGTRLGINTPKPLCIALGRTLVDYVISGISDFSSKCGKKVSYNLVVGHEKETVEAHIKSKFSHLDPSFATQEQQLGTGHAVKVFFEAYPKSWKSAYTLVVCADTPLITEDIYSQLLSEIEDSGVDAVCASFFTQNPTGYGRIEQKNSGFNIIEEKDANESQKAIKEVNSGLYLFKTEHIKTFINKIDDNNKSGEFYLTDLFKEGFNVKTLQFCDEKSFLGVNNLIQLEESETILLRRKLETLMLKGVRMNRADSIYIETNVEITAGTLIEPNVSIRGNTKIGANSVIETGVVIKDSTIGDNTTIKAYSYLEGAIIKNHCAVGPMARLREGTEISDNCKIGNFVETKKSLLHPGAKVSHLSYVGDAEIGENTNIGCGFITCNYDGAEKHKTTIGKNTFIGSDCQMIAPITVGDEAFVGSGSTITKDVPSKAFAIARQRQVTKEDMAARFIKKK